MRLWSIHPKFLDAKGIVALWREGLLAQKVLEDRTRGYKHHPQLIRFRSHRNPLGAIATYLQEIHKEATRRGYQFDGSKIRQQRIRSRLPVTRGQINNEVAHLKQKLKVRNRPTYVRLIASKKILPHPIFRIVSGEIESWER